MTTIRVERRDRFTVISRDLVNDDRLSFRARGLLVWLLDKPDGWSVNSEQIVHAGTEGRDAIRSALRELIACGYVVRHRVRASGGRWVTETVVRETSDDGKPGVGRPGVGRPGANTKTVTEDCPSPLPPKRSRRRLPPIPINERRDYDLTPLTPEEIAAKYGVDLDPDRVA